MWRKKNRVVHGHCTVPVPLHCGDPKTLHQRLFLAPHCTLRLSHLSVGGGGGMSGDWRLWANSTCRSRAMGTIGTNCSRVARATTPWPLPQPHGRVRLGFEVSRFPHFWVGGLACAEFPRGVEFQGSLAPFFLHILKQKKEQPCVCFDPIPACSSHSTCWKTNQNLVS